MQVVSIQVPRLFHGLHPCRVDLSYQRAGQSNAGLAISLPPDSHANKQATGFVLPSGGFHDATGTHS